MDMRVRSSGNLQSPPKLRANADQNAAPEAARSADPFPAKSHLHIFCAAARSAPNFQNRLTKPGSNRGKRGRQAGGRSDDGIKHLLIRQINAHHRQIDIHDILNRRSRFFEQGLRPLRSRLCTPKIGRAHRHPQALKYAAFHFRHRRPHGQLTRTVLSTKASCARRKRFSRSSCLLPNF